MATPVASVVVACYNYAHYLPECVQSILNQTLDDLEVIVVNDASTDNTEEVVRAIADPRVIYIAHEKNTGAAEAMATGFRAARGAYVSHIDADDRYRPRFLEETVPIFSSHPEVGLVYTDSASMDALGRVLQDPWDGMRTHEAHGGRDSSGDEFLLNLEDNLIPAPAVIARREAWLAALPFPEWFTDFTVWDWYLHLRIARTRQVYYRAKTLSDYRLHGNNLHRQPPRNRNAEETIIRILDEMLAGDDRRADKSRVRRRLYGRAYATFAARYLLANMDADGRRCFFKTLLLRPDFAVEPNLLRLLAASVFGRDTYNQVKRIIGRAA